ncbi:MAG: AraD1 family protein [Verrucomicrobiota bacterium]
MVRLVQLIHPQHGRRVATVADENTLRFLEATASIYALAQNAAAQKTSLKQLVALRASDERLDYSAVYEGKSDWRFLPAFDHPDEPARCLVTGTGLTHKKSAENRQSMHVEGSAQIARASSKNHSENEAALTDSMRMYQWGLEGGHPGDGQIGVQPEWFYKGCGTILRAHGEPLEVPNFSGDGGEEAEVAGAYIVDAGGVPHRVGLLMGNEFSDHVMEQKNYLWLAPSKLRTCSIGPELIVGADFADAQGTVKIHRAGKLFWTRPFRTGEKNMSHSMANLEHHHFKYPAHRRAGDAHIYFFGADAFSFGEGVILGEGDIMEIDLRGFGRPLRNPIRIDTSVPAMVRAAPL